MESLVGYGVSSDSEEEGERTQTEQEAKGGGGSKPRNFLLESGSASSESTSESEQEEDQEDAVCPVGTDSSSETLLPAPFSASSHKLPPPPLGRSGLGGLPAGSSVFANPFKERAEERLNALQKHVPLTLQARPMQIGGKRMCVAYRKDGRCRFGIRCKFAHDSDLQSSAGLPTEHPGSENDPVDQTGSSPASSQAERRTSSERGEDEEESHKRKKHKVGLSDTLIPPKRALKQYAMQKDKA